MVEDYVKISQHVFPNNVFSVQVLYQKCNQTLHDCSATSMRGDCQEKGHK